MAHKLKYLRDSFREQLSSSMWTVTGPGLAYYDRAVHFDPSSTPTILESVHSYALTGSEVEAHVGLLGNGQTREYLMECRVDADNGVAIAHLHDQIVFRVRVAGVNNDVTLPMDPTTMSYWRIEERGGIVYFYTSSDFIAWKRQRIATHGLDLSSVKLRFTVQLNVAGVEGGTYGGGTYGGDFYGGVSGVEPDIAHLYTVNKADPVASTAPALVTTLRAASWRWSIGSWKENIPSHELIYAGMRSLHLHLLDPSEAEFTTWGEADEAAQIEEAISDLWVMRDTETLFRGRVIRTNDQLDVTTHSVSVAATDYRGILDRRTLQADTTFTAQDQAFIVQSLIASAQAETGGYIGIQYGETISTIPLTGVIRTVEFREGQSVWSAINSMSRMSSGFELDIDEYKLLTLYYPSRGEDNEEVLDFGGTVKSVSRSMNLDGFGNAIRQSGATGITAATKLSADIGSAPEGRWDLQFGDIDLTTSDMVEKSALAKLELANRLLPTYQLTLNPGAWRGPSHIWLGDYVYVVVKSGRLVDVVKMRVYDIDIEVDINNHETVSITVGDPKLTVASMLHQINRNLRALQRN